MLTAVKPMNETLLSCAVTDAQGQSPLVRTLPLNSSVKSDAFHLSERIYTQQYAGIYFTRLNLLRQRVLKRAQQCWF